MYLVLIFGAIFRPKKTAAKISCAHEGTTNSALIDTGMNKMWWCTSCDATWFLSGSAA